MSVLDDVVSMASKGGSIHDVRDTKYSLPDIVKEVNAIHRPEEGDVTIVLEYRDKLVVSAGRRDFYVECLRAYIRNSAMRMCKVTYVENKEDVRKFTVLVQPTIDYSVIDYINEIKPYLLPSDSVELLNINIIVDRKICT